MNEQILIATRKSALALWQAHTTQSLLAKQNFNCELYPVVTTGDKISHTKLANVNLPSDDGAQTAPFTSGKGLFIKEIQEALLQNKAHIAVHSLKDLPVMQTEKLILSAFLPRANPEDVLIVSPQVMQESGLDKLSAAEKSTLTFTELKNKLSTSTFFQTKPIGTTSLRRQLQVKKYFGAGTPLDILRGNVDTRLKKIRNNEYSCILLARAGLERLDLLATATDMFVLDPLMFIPTPGQGIIALETLATDTLTLTATQKLTDFDTCVYGGLERLVLFLLGGDCHTSIAAFFRQNILHICAGDTDFYLETRILLTSAELVYTRNLFNQHKCIYGSFFEGLTHSPLAQNIAQQLHKHGFSKINPQLLKK